MKRHRDKAYLGYIHTLTCLVCRRPCQHAHHLQRTGEKGMGRKSGDRWAVPLCIEHHDAIHAMGNEELFWIRVGVDPLEWANQSWDTWVAND